MRRNRLIAAAVVLVPLALAVAYLFDPDARLRGWAGGEPFYRGRSTSAWVATARSDEANTRTAAGNELEDGKASSVPVLIEMLRSPGSPEPRQLAADVLGRIGKPDALTAVDPLVAALDDDDPLVREVAVKSLVKLAPDSKAAIPALVRKFPDPAAIRAVSAFKAEAAGTIPDLVPLLTHDDPVVRWNAARTLGKIGDPAKGAVPKILPQFADSEPAVREHAAEALGDIGPAAATPEALALLVKALEDSEWKVRRDAVRSLGQFGPAATGVLGEVRRMANDPNQEVSETASRAARLIDPSLAGKK